MSDLKSATARRNGARSQGPATPEGRARSSKNALKHGLNSQTIVLPHEDPAAFAQLRQSYLDAFHPANQPQADLVETMAAARWRLNRLMQIESHLFEKELCEETAEGYDRVSGAEKMAFVFDRMAKAGRSLALMIRYEGQLNRTYDRAFKQLHTLQKSAASAAPEKLRNEPKPAASPASPPHPTEPSGPPPAHPPASPAPPAPAASPTGG